MAEISSKILEGVFAIKKPPSLSSAQVLRDLQNKFAQSKTFAPLLQETRRKQEEQERHQRKRRMRISDDNAFKMGHGGTLDPLATGVLIVGIGRGTKHLGNFLECTKTYDTVVLLGKSTDTYDVAGRIVTEAPYYHITREIVEKQLSGFRGKIKQVPPIYSALKIKGMKAYEYARSGQELPRELGSREMVVEECTLLDWYEGGQHEFRWPAVEASEADKDAAKKLMKSAATSGTLSSAETGGRENKTGLEVEAADEQSSREVKDGQGPDAALSQTETNKLSPSAKAALHTHDIPTLSDTPANGPAAKIRLTVSSGFYVRSFAHDLGIACRSFGIMAELLRSRQADYTCADPPPEGLVPCLTYEELEQGEEVWGPMISKVLDDWMQKNPVVSNEQKLDDRDKPKKPKRLPPVYWERGNVRKRKMERERDSRSRRNSSSPE